MSRSVRLAFLAVAGVIAIAAVVLIGRGGDDEAEAPATTTTQASAPAPATTTTDAPKPAPKPPLLKPGAVRTIESNKGDTIRFRVRTPTAEEVHVHGYDREFELEAGVTRTISFPATIDGIFEIELHGSGEQIGSLRVEP